jgi:hypothetical protein
MGSVNHGGADAGIAAHWPEVSKEEVFAELAKILDSSHFRTSKKCMRFLRHVVENAAEGRLDCLKERTLGVDVFDRNPHYDTNQDPIVRGTAGEVRKRLAQYYLESDHGGELRISLPAGSYVPDVHRAAVALKAAELTASPVVSVSAAPRIATKSRVSGERVGLGLAAMAACATLLLLWIHGRATNLDRFWAPVLAGHKTVLVCMGQPQEYTFRPETADAINAWFANGAQRHDASPAAIASIPIGQIIPLWGTSVALADAQAFARVFNMFAAKGKQADLRGEKFVSLTDLRGKPVILIGAFDNDWTLNLAGELRYYFEQDDRTHSQTIRDRKNPALSKWKLVNPWPPGNNIDTDYALVTRVVNPTTEKTLVTLAGITQYGTEAAAEFVTNPEYFAKALMHAPKEWYRKNMQVVLSTRVISQTSGPPTVVAVYFW